MHGDLSERSKINTHLVDAIVEATSLVGEDGKGKSGRTGYFKRLALRDPKAMAQLLGKALRWPTQSPDQQSTAAHKWTQEELNKLSPEEINQLYFKMVRESSEFERNTLAQAIVEGAALVGEDGRGKNGLAGYFKRLTRRHPQAVGNLLGRVLPWPTQRSDEKTSAQWQEELENLSDEELKKMLREQEDTDFP